MAFNIRGEGARTHALHCGGPAQEAGVAHSNIWEESTQVPHPRPPPSNSKAPHPHPHNSTHTHTPLPTHYIPHTPTFHT